MRVFSTRELIWTGDRLRLGSARGRVVAAIEADRDWPGMWRVKTPTGHLSDMVNRTRARDAARAIAAADLNSQGAPVEAPPMRYSGQPVSVGLSS